MGKGNGKLKTLGRFYEMVTFLIKNIFFIQKQPTFFNEVSKWMSASRTDGLTTDWLAKWVNEMLMSKTKGTNRVHWERFMLFLMCVCDVIGGHAIKCHNTQRKLT